MKKLFTLAMLLVFGASMQAQDAVAPTNARIDINGYKIALKAVSKPEGGSLQNFNWGKEEERKCNLTGETAPFKDDQWVKSSFTFVPENDGKVAINLMGNWTPNAPGKKKMDARWVLYDMITVEGATLKNGDFEEAQDGKPVAWTCAGFYITSGGLSDSAMVKAWHNQRCSQVIDVKKDQPVTITINAKKGEVEPAKE
jgi:hypothetical protein